MAPSKKLAAISQKKQEKKLLVLDMDNTLMYSSQVSFGEGEDDLVFTLVEGGSNYYVKLRPGVRFFLEKVAEMFDVMIFTAADKDYADKIIDFLDPENTLISRRAYYDDFVEHGCVKDMSKLERDLAKVAIIDDIPQNYQLQKDNGIPIKNWSNEPDDEELLTLLPFLEGLVDVEDVRPVIAERYDCYNKGGFGKKKTNWR
ncbi:hypothetical protein ACHQM5_013792 [Ranunculus cassubicifolius]